MNEAKESFNELLDNLKQLRDELRVQMNLASKEAQEEFHEMEHKWDELMQEGKPFADAISDTAENVGTAAKLAADEMKKGYERIRDLLK